jgi:hypothetical protein
MKFRSRDATHLPRPSGAGCRVSTPVVLKRYYRMNTSNYQLDLPPAWRRPLISIVAVLLIVSTGLNVLAGIIPASTLPGWLGVLDVARAAVLVILGLLLAVVAGNDIHSLEVHTSYRVYRALASVLLVLLGIFFIAGSRLHWDVLLPGLACVAVRICTAGRPNILAIETLCKK